jgi:hypothetical protein
MAALQQQMMMMVLVLALTLALTLIMALRLRLFWRQKVVRLKRWWQKRQRPGHQRGRQTMGTKGCRRSETMIWSRHCWRRHRKESRCRTRNAVTVRAAGRKRRRRRRRMRQEQKMN